MCDMTATPVLAGADKEYSTDDQMPFLTSSPAGGRYAE